MEITPDLKNEMKALVDEIARPFNDKIRDLDQKANARWEELKEKPDAVIGDSLKAILGDRVKAVEDKAEATQKALAARMDELEVKAKQGGGAADPDAEVKAVVEGFKFDAQEFGSKGRFSLPTSFLERKTVATITNALNGGTDFYGPRGGIYSFNQPGLYLRDLVAPGTIDGMYLVYEREKPDMEGDAGYQTEGSAKPTMDAYTEIIRADVVTIAVTARVSQQLFDDRAAFISWLRERMAYRVLRYLDRQMLNGAGTTGTLDGINTVATAYDNSHVGIVEAAQALDVIRFARNQVELADYTPDGTVLHPTTWATIETLKDGDERYLIGDPRTSGSMGVGRVGSVWGMPVVSTTGQTADEFTVGDFRGAAQLFMRQGLEVLASTEDQDNFVKNLVTIRAELRAVQAIYATAAFVTGDLSDSIAAT